ncbi:hypothetical protein ACC797_13455 [Rhizobium ruizarguesonis]
MNNRYAIDLSQVKNSLKAHDDLADYCGAIDRLGFVLSTLAELQDATMALDAIAEIHTDPEALQIVSAALMTHAIMAYCRATHSGGKGRKKVGATKNYTPDQEKKHKDIADLRDQVIAHYGTPTHRHGLKWLDERLVVKIVDEAELFTFSRNRANYLAAAIADLRELLAVATATAEEVMEERSEFLNALNLKHIGDKRVVDALNASPFDPFAFHGVGQMADAFWDVTQKKRSETLRNGDW